MKTFVALLVILTFAGAEAARASRSRNFNCVRHVYNLSNVPVLVGYFAKSGSSTVICSAAGHKQARAKGLGEGWCTIPPHTTVPVGFGLDINGQVYGYVGIMASSGLVMYYFLGYGGIGGAGCPYIQHDGTTQGVLLNDPANGDIQFYGPLGKKSAAQAAKDEQAFRVALAAAKRKAAKRHH
jgi:hypothetical protein